MKLKIIAVGKIKEDFYRKAVAEYVKRLGAYEKPQIITVKEEKAPQSLSPAQEEQVKKKEGRALLAKVSPEDTVVLLDISGREMDSLDFSDYLKNAAMEGTGTLAFLIGGSLGTSEEVRRRANLRLSFSPMTFPHQLMQVILLEQIYRGYRIMENHPYHK